MSDFDFQVSGGAGGTTARYDDLATLAQLSDDLALTLGRVSAEGHTALVDPDLLASAVLDPAGAAAFEKAMLSALDGPGGLTALGLGFGEQAVLLRAVAASYHAVDDAQARAIDSLRWLAGYAAAPLLVAALAGLVTSPLALGSLYAAYRLSDGRIDWQRLLTDHPGVVDNLLGASPGLITALTPLNVHDLPGAAALLGQLYPDGTPTLTHEFVDNAFDATAPPPHGFGDLLDSLDYRNGQGTDDNIDVRVITQPDGSRSYIVDIPGTKAWDGPGANPALNDLGTNIHTLAGQSTAQEQAIADALRRAGAGPTDPVMLVGHSQGGMVAAQAAHDSGTGAFGYNVTHVVTAGSPIGRVDMPDNIQVLSLENSHDIVPHLDAVDNPDRPNRTTVTFDLQNGTIGDNHGTGTSYAPAAHALDKSADPSVLAFHNSAGAFLTSGGGTTVHTHVYTYERSN